jgi:adiponectin receptor
MKRRSGHIKKSNKIIHEIPKEIISEFSSALKVNIIGSTQLTEKFFGLFTSFTKDIPKLLTYSSCPSYLQDNEFILTGYRADYTYYQSTISLFTLHNESGNVWTHLFGFALFLFLILCTWSGTTQLPVLLELLLEQVPGAFISLIDFILFHLGLESWKLHQALLASTKTQPPLPLNLSFEDKIVITIALSLSCYTMLSSSLLHLHCCVSEDAQMFWNCLDHSGISASIAGGSIAVVYLMLHCHGWMRVFWMGMLILFNLVGLIGPMFS